MNATTTLPAVLRDAVVALAETPGSCLLCGQDAGGGVASWTMPGGKRVAVYRSTLKSSAPTWPTTVPDLDKLTRAVLDALTYTIVVDDSQVVDLVAHKIYVPAAETGCTVTVEELP